MTGYTLQKDMCKRDRYESLNKIYPTSEILFDDYYRNTIVLNHVYVTKNSSTSRRTQSRTSF